MLGRAVFVVVCFLILGFGTHRWCSGITSGGFRAAHGMLEIQQMSACKVDALCAVLSLRLPVPRFEQIMHVTLYLFSSSFTLTATLWPVAPQRPHPAPGTAPASCFLQAAASAQGSMLGLRRKLFSPGPCPPAPPAGSPSSGAESARLCWVPFRPASSLAPPPAGSAPAPSAAWPS